MCGCVVITEVLCALPKAIPQPHPTPKKGDKFPHLHPQLWILKKKYISK